jgi:hypothetical protein
MEGERWRFAEIDEDPRRDYTTYATHAITTIATQRDEDADTVRLLSYTTLQYYAATEPANGDTILAVQPNHLLTVADTDTALESRLLTGVRTAGTWPTVILRRPIAIYP